MLRSGCIVRAIIASIALCLAAVGAATATTDKAVPPHRIALVVGVSSYEDAPALPNPASDARAVAAELWESGFEVIELIDPDIRGFRAAIAAMADRLRPGAHAVLYFAGHGVQVDGENYLLAADADVRNGTLDAVIADSVAANEIVTALADSGSAISIVILDACRNNPLGPVALGAAPRGRSVAGLQAVRDTGLAPVRMPDASEVLIGYATAPGDVAVDGPQGGNSPYTQALVRHMATPGLEIGELFRRVRAEVRRTTEGRQLPWVNSSLESSFYFRTAELAPAGGEGSRVDRLGMLPPTDVIESTFWLAALSGGRSEDLSSYLRHFPDGRHAGDASARLALAPSPVAQEEKPTAGVPVLAQAGSVIVPAGTRAPVALGLGGEAVGGFTVTAVPERMPLLLGDGRRVEPGLRLTSAELDALTYQADARTLGSAGALELEAGEGPRGGTHRIEFAAMLDSCDLVAGYPHDPFRVGPGARLELMKPELAIAACQSAVARFPDEPRFQALLGRAYRKAEDYAEAKHWNDRAIAGGYPSAMCAEGKMNRYGLGGPVDFEGAVALYERAIERGDDGCKTELGEMYLFGQGVARDTERGLALFQEAAALGNDWAHTLMGRVHEHGDGVPQNEELSFEWYRSAAEMGDVTAKMKVGQYYEHGRGVERDPAAAYRWYESAAGQGSAYAQARFGVMHVEGVIVPQDPQAALYWFRKAAAQDDPEGQYWLAEALLVGEGTAADPARALELLNAAVEQGHARSMARLAAAYETGDVVGRNLPLALALYRDALAAGYGGAALPLAQAYAKGYGGAVEGARAVVVLETAAAGGDSWAKRDLARLLAAGEIVPGDPVRSATLSREAAAAGNPYALRDHARNLEAGYGQPADLSAAFAAMRAAATAGNAWAALDLARYFRSGVGTAVVPAREAYWLARAAGLDDPAVAAAASERLGGLSRDALVQAIGAMLEGQGEVPPGTGDQLGPDALADLGIEAGSDAELVAALLRLAR